MTYTHTISFLNNDNMYDDLRLYADDWSAVEAAIASLEKSGASAILVTDDEERILYESGTDYSFF